MWRLADGRYEAVAADPGGGVPSVVLAGAEWVHVGGLLRLRDEATGALLPTAKEKQAMRADTEARADAEGEARRQAEADLALLRAEIARLRGA